MSTATETAVEIYPCGCDINEVCHMVSCHDNDVAVCGADVADASWCNDEDNCGAPECAVCADLDASEDLTWCTCPCCADVPAEVSS